MQVHLLGTAAGGGFPQWNCNCANCRGLRSGAVRARSRTQSCVALSADGKHWFLLNASPDVRFQIESFPPLQPAPDRVRGTGIEGVIVTNADLDHTLGLLILREGGRLPIHAGPTVRRALREGLNLEAILDCYCGIEWREPPMELAPLLHADGAPSGLLYEAFSLPGKPPRYFEGRALPAPGDCLGYRFVDERTGGRLLFMPDAAEWNATALEQMRRCDLLLLDGTFWSEDEMIRMGVGAISAARMGHLPVGGPEGSLAKLAALPQSRKIYIHINNTNPILIEDSPERRTVEAAGVEIGTDGMEITL